MDDVDEHQIALVVFERAARLRQPCHHHPKIVGPCHNLQANICQTYNSATNGHLPTASDGRVVLFPGTASMLEIGAFLPVAAASAPLQARSAAGSDCRGRTTCLNCQYIPACT
ncbi:hypothetical protein ACVIU7_002023 [Bradyrhizobium liaoningense]